MVLEINLKPESVTSLERFLNTNTYKELAESTMSFNRRLNEERKMRIPYIDGQTGVAQVGGVRYRTKTPFLRFQIEKNRDLSFILSKW